MRKSYDEIYNNLNLYIVNENMIDGIYDTPINKFDIYQGTEADRLTALHKWKTNTE
jgi:hypothetical protein